MSVIVEFLSFYDNCHNFVPKEVAIIDNFHCRVQCWLIKPPFSDQVLLPKYKATNRWLTSNYHRLEWDDGDVAYSDLDNLLNRYTRNFSVVFTKGREKAAYLRRILRRHVVDLESMKCPSLSRLPYIDVECLVKEHGDPESQCALRNAARLSSWCTDNRDVTDLSTPQARLSTFSDFTVPFVRPVDLADAGFYSTKEGDRVQCAYCPLSIKHWHSVDVPKVSHKHSNPSCPAVHEFDSGVDVCGCV